MSTPTAPPEVPHAHAPGYHAHAPAPKTSGLAIASLVLGIAGICIAWIPWVGGVTALVSAILAIIFGSMALKQIRERPAEVGGKGMAIAGIVLGIITLAFALLVILILGAILATLFGAAGAAGGV